MAGMIETAEVVSCSVDGSGLTYTNRGGNGFVYLPSLFTVTTTGAALLRWCGPVKRVRLSVPQGWRVAEPERVVLDGERRLIWQVEPRGTPPACLVNLELQVDRDADAPATIVRAVSIELWAESQFRLDRHRLPFANAAYDVGEVAPSPTLFAQTYRSLGALSRVFYRGLYSHVVFISADPHTTQPGGLCTGMARVALEASLSARPASLDEADADELRQTVALWHGRQLSDQALLASTMAWLRQGSREAYLAFRRSLLDGGRSELAFDLNVPRPWRRDLLRAFVGQGHTVVPYALRQRTDHAAEVWIYDPNYPREPEASRSVVRFDLRHNTFHYRTMRGDRPGRPSKVIAVPQSAYRRAATGFLASLLSAVLYPNSWWANRWLGGGRAILAWLHSVTNQRRHDRGPVTGDAAP
jgi:hypothetical protein